MDLKGTWQGRHISGGKTTYPFKARFEEMDDGGYVLAFEADEGFMKLPYVNDLGGILHNKDTFEARIDKKMRIDDQTPFDAIEQDYVRVYRENGVPTFWLTMNHKGVDQIVVFTKNMPKPTVEVPKVVKSATPMKVDGVFYGRWYRSAADYNNRTPIYEWVAAVHTKEDRYYLELVELDFTGQPTQQDYRFRLKFVQHGENGLTARISMDPQPKKDPQPYNKVRTADMFIIKRDNSPKQRPEFVLYIEGHKHIFTMNSPPSDDNEPQPKPPPKPREPAHTSYPRGQHIPGTYKDVTVKSKTRECVKRKPALAAPDKDGKRRPMYKKNGEPVL